MDRGGDGKSDGDGDVTGEENGDDGPVSRRSPGGDAETRGGEAPCAGKTSAAPPRRAVNLRRSDGAAREDVSLGSSPEVDGCPGRRENAVEELCNAPNGLTATRAILRYIMVAHDRLDHSKNMDISEKVKHLLGPNNKAIMQTLYDQMNEIYMEQGIERGRLEGSTLGRRETLLRLLRRRFGELNESVSARVQSADAPALDTWLDRILTARTLDEVWEEGQSAPTK
jgi:hypothetical protein